MGNLLSIGEVAKIRDINVQSLRYYEKLGILIPAYINPDSGYRYYTPDQIMILDTIILCIELGIPLKELKEYVGKDGQLEFERLLNYGRMLAKEKMQKIESNIDSIDRTLEYINAQRDFLGREGYYSRYIYERSIITIPSEIKMDAKTYERNLSKLFNVAKKFNLQASFPHGLIANYKNGEFKDSLMFLEVMPEYSAHNSDKSFIDQEANKSTRQSVTILPARNYLCFQEPREVHSDPLSIFPKKLTGQENATIIISSMSPDTYKYDKVILEFQVAT